MKGLTFSQALVHLTAGGKAARLGWNAPHQFVTVQVPDEHSKMGAPYAYLHNAQGINVPWVPSQGDLFAQDWVVVA